MHDLQTIIAMNKAQPKEPVKATPTAPYLYDVEAERDIIVARLRTVEEALRGYKIERLRLKFRLKEVKTNLARQRQIKGE